MHKYDSAVHVYGCTCVNLYIPVCNICIYTSLHSGPSCLFSLSTILFPFSPLQQSPPPTLSILLFPSQMLPPEAGSFAPGSSCAQQLILRCLSLGWSLRLYTLPSFYPSVSCKSCYCVFVPGCEDSSQVLTCDYVSTLFNILIHRNNNTHLYTCVLHIQI